MSKKAKIVIAVVVILIIAGLVYWFVIKPKMDKAKETEKAADPDAGTGEPASVPVPAPKPPAFSSTKASMVKGSAIVDEVVRATAGKGGADADRGIAPGGRPGAVMAGQGRG
jgi:hypothetical protein